MTSKKDPKKPKKNSELTFIEKAMIESWRRFRTAENYSQKRGNAMILQAHIEEWLDQPESICDLEEGTSSETRLSWRPDGIPENAELPFDRSGKAVDAFFFFTGGTMSQIFSKADLDANPDMVRNYGYYVVTVYQKLHATGNATEMHFTSDEAVKRHIRTSTTERWPQKGDYDVLADPLGCPDYKKTIAVGRYKNRDIAVAKADKLAVQFGIRFVVARVIGNVDNH